MTVDETIATLREFASVQIGLVLCNERGGAERTRNGLLRRETSATCDLFRAIVGRTPTADEIAKICDR